VEASALKHAGVGGLHGRSPLMRLQSDERLIALVRRGNHGAFEAIVARYQSRLLAFCRHMLGSREDAEDVLQEVFAAAFNAILADDRPINARPWLYRIARNRSLNHLRRTQPIGVDSMDVHLAEHGTTTADKVDKREQFRELIADVQELPETQRTALLLREIDALSYEQIAEAMETTIPSVKSLLVRARVSLAEAAEARQLSCEDVRLELAEIAEGLQRRTTAPARRHLRTCDRCGAFRTQLKSTNKALAAVMPVGFALALRKLVLAHLGLSAGAGAGGGASGTAAAGAAAGSAAAGSATGGLVSVGIGTVATKAAAGLAAAALVTAGAVEIEHRAPRVDRPAPLVAQAPADVRAPAADVRPAPARVQRQLDLPARASATRPATARAASARPSAAASDPRRDATTTPAADPTRTQPGATAPAGMPTTPASAPGQTQVESGTTALPSELPQQLPTQTLAGATQTSTSPGGAPAPTTSTPAPPPPAGETQPVMPSPVTIPAAPAPSVETAPPVVTTPAPPAVTEPQTGTTPAPAPPVPADAAPTG
jgi:RNA polymerase sigma factor (sigma-70 family)